MSRKSIEITGKGLGMALIFALVIEYVLPVIKLGKYSWIGTLIVLIVALYLILFD